MKGGAGRKRSDSGSLDNELFQNVVRPEKHEETTEERGGARNQRDRGGDESLNGSRQSANGRGTRLGTP